MGIMTFKNPFGGFTCMGCSTALAQVTLAPGCIAPGRSVIALFVNTAALLWFFLYLLFDLSSSWGDVCPSRDPGTSFSSDPWGWLTAGAPSPIHWLLLIFAVAGIVIVLLSFFQDIFTPPRPPPRSYYEAALWRGRRQVLIVLMIMGLACFIGWGIALAYFTLLGDECSTKVTSLYNIALLLVLLLLTVIGVGLLLGCCVLLDCCISGRVRFVVLLSNRAQTEKALPPEQYASTALPEADERLQPGVPERAPPGSYGTTGRAPSGAFLVGGIEEGPGRSLEAAGATWQPPPRAPSVKR